jgi:hypothetical protein
LGTFCTTTIYYREIDSKNKAEARNDRCENLEANVKIEMKEQPLLLIDKFNPHGIPPRDNVPGLWSTTAEEQRAAEVRTQQYEQMLSSLEAEYPGIRNFHPDLVKLVYSAKQVNRGWRQFNQIGGMLGTWTNPSNARATHFKNANIQMRAQLAPISGSAPPPPKSETPFVCPTK